MIYGSFVRALFSSSGGAPTFCFATSKAVVDNTIQNEIPLSPDHASYAFFETQLTTLTE
jgi:hypothetical protein